MGPHVLLRSGPSVDNYILASTRTVLQVLHVSKVLLSKTQFRPANKVLATTSSLDVSKVLLSKPQFLPANKVLATISSLDVSKVLLLSTNIFCLQTKPWMTTRLFPPTASHL